MGLIQVAEVLVADLRDLRFRAPVTHVYNPLVYARAPHVEYLRRFGSSPGAVVLLGMNPGPWGMAQTGVPFGEVNAVRNWLGIEGPVGKPRREHPKRPVQGFSCPHSEVSGARIWGWARALFGTPNRFFARFFVANYCPLLFIEESGRNRTPDKLPAAERGPLFAACDQALRKTAQELQVRQVIGIGVFAETRARVALEGLEVKIGRILHPSPANPQANSGWAKKATAQLSCYGVKLPGE